MGSDIPHTVLTLEKSHGHGPEHQEREIKDILSLFPGIYNSYQDGQEQFGPGIVIYVPETRKDAGFLAVSQMPHGDGMRELTLHLRAQVPDQNHVPVVFLYKCGCVSGYVMTAGYAMQPGQPNFATITAEVYGHLDAVKAPRFVGEEPPETWELDL